MLAQEATHHLYEALELLERDEVAAVREVDAPALAPVLLERGGPGFEVGARHHRASRQQQRAVYPMDRLWFLLGAHQAARSRLSKQWFNRARVMAS